MTRGGPFAVEEWELVSEAADHLDRPFAAFEQKEDDGGEPTDQTTPTPARQVERVEAVDEQGDDEHHPEDGVQDDGRTEALRGEQRSRRLAPPPRTL